MRSKLKAQKQFGIVMAKRRKNKQKQQQQKPHIFYLKFTGLRWWSKPPTKEKKLVIMGHKIIQIILVFLIPLFCLLSRLLLFLFLPTSSGFQILARALKIRAFPVTVANPSCCARPITSHELKMRNALYFQARFQQHLNIQS